ncbi:polysaccharide biosynthesis/export family protein [Imperialibacter roseus]|uniref:Polysaccharide biosynthesis/export family protein n=2 Tax=Imperialibacter TaxID=1649461 RepID=A0ABZ0IL54_9BACT|nr:polysaccharide biosynthesis/export family protein [Imperialibacter roseus]WOK05758.1 polysaccharide biosynthesis/export family protein [Imperialibacter roseus]
MFKMDEEFTESDLKQAVSLAEKNYQIKKDDYLRLDVFTNGGERIVDPNFELRQGMTNQNMQNTRQFVYLVRQDGLVKLPMVGDVDILGMTIYEAEQKLQALYSEHYIDPYVVLRYENRRVIVLGANGGQVIPLVNENTSLIEVIALSGGINQGAKSQTVRLIRGNLNNPEVYMIDLSTVSGMRSSIVRLEPGDIVYIDPWRRVWIESLRDVSPILSLITGVITLALVVKSINLN